MLKRVILSCGALAKELRHITSHQASMDALVFVPPSQHLDPTRLRTELVRRLTLLQKKYEQIFVLFGLCFPDMDQILARFDAKRIRGEHCLEIAGGQLFWRIMKESPGSYFLIPSWCFNFRKMTVKGLCLEEIPAMKSLMFQNYTQVVYFDTLIYGDIDSRAKTIADYLNLPLRIDLRAYRRAFSPYFTIT